MPFKLYFFQKASMLFSWCIFKRQLFNERQSVKQVQYRDTHLMAVKAAAGLVEDELGQRKKRG